MRKIILLTCLVTIPSNVTSAGMPYFHQGDQAAAPRAEKESYAWKLPRLWGKKDNSPNPQMFYQAPADKPTTTERITSAFTGGGSAKTSSSWMTPKTAAAGGREVDPISLNHPTGKPTPALLVSMAQVQEKQGDLAGARHMYQKALAAGPKNENTLREIGHFEDRQNRLADAERYYNEAAKLAPKNPAVLNDLALCLARQGKAAESAQVLSQAIQLAPTKPLYRNNMATVLMELGDQQNAMQHLMAVHPPAGAYYNMGHLLEKGSQHEAAAAHYAEALRLDPAMTPAHAALARVAPPFKTNVPQTAMAPATANSRFDVQEMWPSEPIVPPTESSATREPKFGPRLLPPVE